MIKLFMNMTCSLCGKEVEIDKYFTRKSLCPKCGGDLHICLNCRFYSETSHNKCLEVKAEFQRVRDKANFCDYFKWANAPRTKSAVGDPAEEARRKFESLFKKN